MVDDPDSDDWNDFLMNKEKVRVYDDKLGFRDSGVVFTLKGDILSMINDYDFNKTDSPEAKQSIIFLDEMHIDMYAKSKRTRDTNLIKNYYNKRILLASGLHEAILLSENPNELCDRLRSRIRENKLEL